ncbi:hypothetical protein IV38_GL001150 [Lactobacillus selangorensis]|uniref:TcaA 4th domain-containing protein n=1 Tax=Lactobacillus selangorensis TaxID=81857 RepID=A0A0R2FMK8_9LACO|nr:hypothetical protein IV38_GL001150 [Lactobacillus selangorensis]KRN32651.1 hypothetical protein IV40_GL000703 [Lactobacillus selangorensis]
MKNDPHHKSPSHVAPHQQSPVGKILTSVVVIVLLVGGYLWGRSYNSAANQLQRAATALAAKNGDSSRYFTTNSKVKLNQKTLQPTVTYLQNHQQVMKALKKNGTAANGLFKWVKDGKTGLFYARYRIQVKTVQPSVKTDVAGAALTVDGHKTATSTKQALTKKVGPLLPGRYTLQASAGQQQKKLTTDITTNQTYSLPLVAKTYTMTVQGNSGATVYLNGQSKGKLPQSGTMTFPNIPWHDQFTYQLKYKRSDGQELTSQTQTITHADDGKTIAAVYAGAVTTADANTLFNNLWYEAAQVVKNGTDKNHALADYFVNGQSNAYYQDLLHTLQNYQQSYSVKSLKITSDATASVPLPNDQSRVALNVYYDFTNQNQSKDKTHHLEKYYGEAVLNKVDSGYKVQTFGMTTKYFDQYSK